MKNSLFRLLFLLLLVSCVPREQTITLIATNDIHAAIDPFPQLATLVEAERAANPGRVILLDAGDRWSGNPYVDMATEGGQPIIDLMDSLGYDLATLGNHEFDFGLELLKKRIEELDAPIVCANVDPNGSLLPEPRPYAFIEVGGVKLGFLGLLNTENGGYPAGLIEHFGSIKFANPLTKALEYKGLRDSCDLFIGLTHLGFEHDTLLAREMPELDLIVGGHSHTVLPEGVRIGGTLVTQSGARLRYASLTTITIRGRKLVGIENRLVKLDTVAPDSRFEAMVAEYKNRPELLTVIGQLSRGLDKTGLLNLTTDMMRSRVAADLALYNSGGVRLDTLAPGDVTMAQVYTMEPFGNTIQTLRMTLDEVKTLILNGYNTSTHEGYRALDIWPSGFSYTIVTDPASGDATDVEIRLAGKPAPSGVYTVAAPNYLFMNYPFDKRGLGEESGVRIGAVMAAFLDKHSPYAGNNTSRIDRR